MNYKKIAILLTFMLGAAALCKAGIYAERHDKLPKQRVYAAPDERERKESEKIAVVNLDEGVATRQGQIYYGERLSKFPCMDFEYASLEAARNGLETGSYGAYVIIPAAFSQNVESINTTPQISQLEYRINSSYSGKKQYELLYNVRSYIDSLDNHLSYMYVDNILREFHEAQDGAVRVMENDLRDMEAIEKIQAQDLVTLIEIPEPPKEELMPKILDISEYTAQSVRFAETLAAKYEDSFQDIQTEIASLCAGGLALSESLKSLAGQVRELTVDENEEDIAVKAEEKLWAELERQSKKLLEKEKLFGYLKKFKEDNEEVIKMLGQSSSGCQSFEEAGFSEDAWQEEAKPPDSDIQKEDKPSNRDIQEETKPVLSLLAKQNEEIDFLLEEIAQTEELNIDRITELVKREYIAPVKDKTDRAKRELLHSCQEELTAILAYNGQLSRFRPQVKDSFLEPCIGQLQENHRSMEEALSDNQQAYMEFAQKSAESSREYTAKIQKHVAEAKTASEEALAQGIGAAKEMKEKNSAMNQGILGGFSSKLAYTRIGSAEYTRIYQFVANPLRAVDRSMSQAAAND